VHSFAVVLDANVIVPIAATDLLLRLAERELFRPLWSARILDETFYAIAKIHPELTESQIRARLVAMNGAFEDALITGWEKIEASLELPDENDRHVLACAIVGGADATVTNNVDDFPTAVLATFCREAIGLDDFLLDLIDHAAGEVAGVIHEMARDMKNPAISTSDVLDAAARAGAPRAVEWFRSELAR